MLKIQLAVLVGNTGCGATITDEGNVKRRVLPASGTRTFRRPGGCAAREKLGQFAIPFRHPRLPGLRRSAARSHMGLARDRNAWKRVNCD
jgi:hypothetical protein